MSNTKIKDQTVFLLDDKQVASTDLVSVLRRKGRMTSIVQELILEHELSTIKISESEKKALIENFRNENKLESKESFLNFLEERHLTEDLLEKELTIPVKIIKYREDKWGPRANSLYLKHKEKYDLIVYNRLECKSPDVMQEVYFRLKDNEESWDSLARQFFIGKAKPTAQRGPMPVNQVEEVLVKEMKQQGTGVVCKPINLGMEVAVVQLERFEPSKFDKELRSQIIREEFEQWLRTECNKMMSKVTYTT